MSDEWATAQLEPECNVEDCGCHQWPNWVHATDGHGEKPALCPTCLDTGLIPASSNYAESTGLAERPCPDCNRS